MTDIGRRIESAKRSAVIYRNYRRARERALTRLSNAYPETYKELLEQEKIVDEQLGKKWLDIDGSTSAIDSVHTDTTGAYTTSSGRGREEASSGEDESDNGGKA
jgi:hypothetical protein